MILNGTVWKESIGFVKANMAEILRINFLYIFLIIFCNYLIALGVLHFVDERGAQNLIHALLNVPFAAFFTKGIFEYYFRLKKGMATSAKLLVKGKNYAKDLGIYFFLVFILGALYITPLFDLERKDWFEISHIVVSFFIFIWFFVRTIFTILIIIESNSNFGAAMVQSFRLTRNISIQIAFILLLLILILLSGILLAGFGLLLTTGFFIAASINIYLKCKENHAQRT